MLPFELMPMFDYGGYWEVRDLKSLGDAARRLLGFGTTIQRVVTTTRLPDSVPLTSDMLLCRVVHDASLSSAVEELNYLLRHPNASVDGPWPETVLTESEATELLCLGLIDPV